jgi:hypothetical protein
VAVVETFIRQTVDLAAVDDAEAAAVGQTVPPMRRATHRSPWRDNIGRHGLATASRWTAEAVASKAGIDEMRVDREALTPHVRSTCSRTNHAAPKS